MLETGNWIGEGKGVLETGNWIGEGKGMLETGNWIGEGTTSAIVSRVSSIVHL